MYICIFLFFFLFIYIFFLLIYFFPFFIYMFRMEIVTFYTEVIDRFFFRFVSRNTVKMAVVLIRGHLASI